MEAGICQTISLPGRRLAYLCLYQESFYAQDQRSGTNTGTFFQRPHRRRLGVKKEFHFTLHNDTLILRHRTYFSRPADGVTDARAD